MFLTIHLTWLNPPRRAKNLEHYSRNSLLSHKPAPNASETGIQSPAGPVAALRNIEPKGNFKAQAIARRAGAGGD